jgi:hypothetical protein
MPEPAPGAYHRTPVQYGAALLGAVLWLAFTAYLVFGVLGTVVYGVALLLKIAGIIPS